MEIPVRWRQLSEPNDQVTSVSADGPCCMLNLAVITGYMSVPSSHIPHPVCKERGGKLPFRMFAKAYSCAHITQPAASIVHTDAWAFSSKKSISHSWVNISAYNARNL